MRAGNYVQQLQGDLAYKAFIPEPLPLKPAIRMDGELSRLLSDADRALGRLDGVSTILPNPDLFVAMYVRHEAVLSSQIEGTQSTLEDLLQYEALPNMNGKLQDVDEVVNYVAAMNYGLKRLETLPLSLRLLREIHAHLLKGVRGADRSPGEFRTTQNWVGMSGATLSTAQYVPPPPHVMNEALDNLEKFLHNQSTLPVLIHCGIAHAQFETIHPFLDGNGRIGRLLITLLLCQQKILYRPLLYLSYYLKAHRSQYYDRLTSIRNEGDWEGWLKFFLRGVYEVSQSATEVAREILKLRENHRDVILQKTRNSANGLKLLDFLFANPVISISLAQDIIKCSYVTASGLIDNLEQLGILVEITGHKRNRFYRYDSYYGLFNKQIFTIPTKSSTENIT